MMDTVTFEQLVTYLPYKVGAMDKRNKNRKQNLYSGNINDFILGSSVMLLRPIEEANDYFESIRNSLDYHDKDMLSEELLSGYFNISLSEIQDIEVDYLPYGTVQLLLKHHFDIFGLLDKGLAFKI